MYVKYPHKKHSFRFHRRHTQMFQRSRSAKGAEESKTTRRYSGGFAFSALGSDSRSTNMAKCSSSKCATQGKPHDVARIRLCVEKSAHKSRAQTQRMCPCELGQRVYKQYAGKRPRILKQPLGQTHDSIIASIPVTNRYTEVP